MEKQGSGSVYGNVVDKHSAIDMSPNNGMEEEEWRARAYICERLPLWAPIVTNPNHSLTNICDDCTVFLEYVYLPELLLYVSDQGTLLSTDSHNSTLEANAHSSQEAKLRYYTTAMKELGIHVPFTSLHPNNEPNLIRHLNVLSIKYPSRVASNMIRSSKNGMKEKKLWMWIEAVLGSSVGPRDTSFFENLKSGVVLVKLLNKLLAACRINVQPVKYSESNSIWQQRENISKFVSGCNTYFPSISATLFTANDLVDMKNPTQVLNYLESLALLSSSNQNIPSLDRSIRRRPASISGAMALMMKKNAIKDTSKQGNDHSVSPPTSTSDNLYSDSRHQTVTHVYERDRGGHRCGDSESHASYHPCGKSFSAPDTDDDLRLPIPSVIIISEKESDSSLRRSHHEIHAPKPHSTVEITAIETQNNVLSMFAEDDGGTNEEDTCPLPSIKLRVEGADDDIRPIALTSENIITEIVPEHLPIVPCSDNRVITIERCSPLVEPMDGSPDSPQREENVDPGTGNPSSFHPNTPEEECSVDKHRDRKRKTYSGLARANTDALPRKKDCTSKRSIELNGCSVAFREFLSPLVSRLQKLINQPREMEWRILHLAIALVSTDEDVATIIQLVRYYHPSVNARNINGWTPLHVAASLASPSAAFEIAKALVEKGANVNQATYSNWRGWGYRSMDRGWTPLHVASEKGNWKVVKFLISKGAAIDYRTDSSSLEKIGDYSYSQWTPLHLAIYNYHLKTVEKNASILHTAGTLGNAIDIAYQCYLETLEDEPSTATTSILPDFTGSTFTHSNSAKESVKSREILALLLSHPHSFSVAPLRPFHCFLKDTYGENLDKLSTIKWHS